jgi:pyruvate formate lyase activating enzyme
MESLGTDLDQPARWWHRTEQGRFACDLCPKACVLKPGQRGLCAGRLAAPEGLVATTWGRSSGLAVDPVEKKPLYHFLPGTAIFSLGTIGCNLACSFCQNWGISMAKASSGRLRPAGRPEEIAELASEHGCASVAFTYNEPVVWAEYAIDVAAACHARGLRTVAVTNGFISEAARPEFFGAMDAANVDLKAFTDIFYRKTCKGRLEPVLDTLRYIARERRTWLEVTTLLIPGANDSESELGRLTGWVARELGAEVPVHFSAFHPDHEMLDRPRTPVDTLLLAREKAKANGIAHVYLGNILDSRGSSTVCASCGKVLLRRSGFNIAENHLQEGRCPDCNAVLAGVFV